MTVRVRHTGEAVRRVLENASLLIFASLGVVAVALDRYAVALVWWGALLVFFAQAWEGRSAAKEPDPAAGNAADALRRRRIGALRCAGLLLAAGGVLGLIA
jgi:hypothetical protein